MNKYFDIEFSVFINSGNNSSPEISFRFTQDYVQFIELNEDVLVYKVENIS